jgi:hypothetical protein
MKKLLLPLLLLLTVGCYTAPQEALDLVNDSIAVTAGHAADPKNELSPLAESAFLADHDAWQKVRKLCWGVEVSPEVQARTDARTPAGDE